MISFNLIIFKMIYLMLNKSFWNYIIILYTYNYNIQEAPR